MIVIFLVVSPVVGQNLEPSLEVSGLASYGWEFGADNPTTDQSLYGASFGWQSAGRSGIVVDYGHGDFEPPPVCLRPAAPSGDQICFRFNYDRHWLSGSYRVQALRDRVKPFFQAGLGAVWTRPEVAGDSRPVRVVLIGEPFTLPPGPGRTKSTDLAVVLGVGATIELGRNFFVRPQARTYGYKGPTFMSTLGIAAGLRF